MVGLVVSQTWTVILARCLCCVLLCCSLGVVDVGGCLGFWSLFWVIFGCCGRFLGCLWFRLVWHVT